MLRKYLLDKRMIGSIGGGGSQMLEAVREGFPEEEALDLGIKE